MVPTTLSRRDALAGAGSLLAGLAGCSGPAARPTAEEPTPDVTPGRRADPPHLLVRTPDRDPVLYVEREDGDGTTRTGRTRGFVASAEDSQALAVADVDGADDVRAFLDATDFGAETVFYRRGAIRECYRRVLCHVAWTATSIDLRFADVLRPATVECEADARDGLTALVRVPEPLDPGAVSHYSAGHSVGRGGCRTRSDGPGGRRERDRTGGRTMIDGGATRRGVLTAGGVALAALAGCGGVLGSDDRPPTIAGDQLRSLASAGGPDLAVPMPVGVAPAHVAAGVERVRSALEAVPDPLGPAAVPNGVVRERLVDHRTAAREALDRATTREGVGALAPLREARAAAAYAAAGYRAVGRPDQALADLEDEASTVRERRRRTRERWTYVGEDPAAAVLVHATVESLLERAGGRIDDAGADLDGARKHALTAAEVAGQLARARAAVDDAAHLADRIERGGNARDLRDRFATAARTLGRRLDGRRRALPDADGTPGALVERDVSDTPAEWVLDALYRAVTTETTPTAGEPELARRILGRRERLAAADALETVRDRIADGERFVPSSAADVRARRAAAVEAVESARGSGPYPGLVDEGLVELAGALRFADDRLGNVDDSVRPETVDEEIGTYVRVETTAQALPGASRVAGDALTGGDESG